MSVSCRCVINWVSNVTRCLRLKLLFVQGLHQAGGGFRRLISQTFWSRQEIRLDESRLGAELTGKTILVTGAEVQSVENLSPVSRFNTDIIVLLGHGKTQIYLVYHELIRKSSGIDYVPVIARWPQTMTVSCKSLSSTSQLLFIMRQPTSTFYDGRQSKKKPSKTISVEPTIFAKAVDEAKYLRWLWFHQMLWEQPARGGIDCHWL